MHRALTRDTLITLLLAGAFTRLVWAGGDSIPRAEDLSRLAAESKQRRIPILLVVSQYHCGYCERMKQEVLLPMQLSGDYVDRVLMRELMIDPGETVIDFAGKREDAAAFAARYKVNVTPTLLFLAPDGTEAAERIRGINTVDYLLFYIEQAIDAATEQMNSRTTASR
ncbi:MAG: thioredoxin fold domain-containing protein [Candidatus Thiodiazotropha sp.]